MRRSLGIIALLAGAALALSCSQTTEPEFAPEGRVTLRFEPAALAAAAARDGRTTAATTVIDSVVVHVFRSGSPLLEEASRSAAIGTEPVEMAIDCVAENDKRISVDLYQSGFFTHHGYKTGVDVVKGQNTPVTIDAYLFVISALSVSPAVVSNPASFDLSWTSAPAAQRYDVQSSSTITFDTIEWEQTQTDTFLTVQLPPGSHYFRVIPQTNFADGLGSIPEFGYVMDGASSINITGFAAPAAIPGDVMTVLGENLDFPGTRVWIGSQEMTIVSASWGSLDVRVPRSATTEYISASSLLGTDTSPTPLLVQRVAYVTTTDEWAAEYTSLLMEHLDDFGYSGVATIPVEDLDTRDMGVFDIVIVANDTGTSPSDWGDGVPARAFAIAASTANVLAIGEGGLAYLRIAVSSIASVTTQTRNLTSYYVTTPAANVFQTPHAVTSGGAAQWVDICTSPDKTLAVDMDPGSAPAGVTTRACTGLVILLPNNKWALIEFQVPDVFSPRKHLFYFGHTDDPTHFTKEGQYLLANMMSVLYNDRADIPPAPSAQR